MFKSFVGAFPAALDVESSVEPEVPVVPVVSEMPESSKQDPLVSASILQKIDQLREKNIGKHVPLPQVCIVVHPSSSRLSSRC